MYCLLVALAALRAAVAQDERGAFGTPAVFISMGYDSFFEGNTTGIYTLHENILHMVIPPVLANYSAARQHCAQLSAVTGPGPPGLATAGEGSDSLSFGYSTNNIQALAYTSSAVFIGEPAEREVWAGDGHRPCTVLRINYATQVIELYAPINCSEQRYFACALDMTSYRTVAAADGLMAARKLAAKRLPPLQPDMAAPPLPPGAAVHLPGPQTVGLRQEALPEAGSARTAAFDDWDDGFLAAGPLTAIEYGTTDAGLVWLSVTYGSNTTVQHGDASLTGTAQGAVRLQPGDLVVRVQGCYHPARGMERLTLHTRMGFQYHVGIYACSLWFEAAVEPAPADINQQLSKSSARVRYLAALGGVLLDGRLAQLQLHWAAENTNLIGSAPSLKWQAASLPRSDATFAATSPQCASAPRMSEDGRCGPTALTYCPSSQCCGEDGRCASTVEACQLRCQPGWGACDVKSGGANQTAAQRQTFVYLEEIEAIALVAREAFVPYTAANEACLDHPFTLSMPATHGELTVIMNAPRLQRAAYTALFPSESLYITIFPGASKQFYEDWWARDKCGSLSLTTPNASVQAIGGQQCNQLVRPLCSGAAALPPSPLASGGGSSSSKPGGMVTLVISPAYGQVASSGACDFHDWAAIDFGGWVDSQLQANRAGVAASSLPPPITALAISGVVPVLLAEGIDATPDSTAGQDVLGALQLRYGEQPGPLHGLPGQFENGSFSWQNVSLLAGERITRVAGCYGGVMERLIVYTNFGRKHIAPLSYVSACTYQFDEPGTAARQAGAYLVAVCGSAGRLVERLAFVWAVPVQPMPPPAASGASTAGPQPGGSGGAAGPAALAGAVSAAVAAAALAAVVALIVWRRRRQRSSVAKGPPPPSASAKALYNVDTSSAATRSSSFPTIGTGSVTLPSTSTGAVSDKGGDRAQHPTSPESTDPLLSTQLSHMTGARLDMQLGVDVILEPDGFLGDGSSGVVVKGVYQHLPVAVKFICHPQAVQQLEQATGRMSPYLKGLIAEITVLSKVQHPHVVTFLGGSLQPPNMFIVEELMPQSLFAYIHEPGQAYTLHDALRIVRDVATGLAGLHPNIVHRDLKPGNILLTADGLAKISDFGLARFKLDTYLSTSRGEAGTLSYMAPEVFGQRASRTTVPAQPPVSLTCSVDIYALGVVLWELLARQLPWDGLHGMMVAYSVSQGERPSALPPPLPTELAQQPGAAAIHAALWTPEVCQLIADCWHQDWRQRPLAPQVMARLNSIMDGLPDTGAANPQVPITLEGGTLESRLHTVV